MESDNVAAIKEAKGRLEQASHKFAERIYQQHAQQQAGAQGQPGAGKEGEDGNKGAAEGGEKVYDADYEVVDDDKK
jgi:molecular chaperone DnaK